MQKAANPPANCSFIPLCMTLRCAEDSKEGDKFAGHEGALLVCADVETSPVRGKLSVMWRKRHLLVAL